MNTNLQEIARAVVSDGRGILASDERPQSLTKRFAARSIASTPESRRAYRELLFGTPGIAESIGGAILRDETIRQSSGKGGTLVDLLEAQGVVPGIKVDAGAKPLANAPGELVTEGLDGLRGHLEEYRRMGARFAKWRAVFVIGEGLPSTRCVRANAAPLARYAALCQEQDLVPIVEPEVLMKGAHSLARCEAVTGDVLQAVFDALFEQGVALEGLLLKPNMVTAGADAPKRASVDEVAQATLRVLSRHVPPAVPAVVFLSGGQEHVLVTRHLSALNEQSGPKPWTLSFSFGRALQDEVLAAWRGEAQNVQAAQRAFHHRAACDRAAALGRYRSSMEREAA